MFTNDANGPDCWKCSLTIEWHDCSWCPVISLRQGIARRSGTAIKPLAMAALLPHPARRKNFFKPMKKPLSTARRFRAGFTLVELLVVIAIIGILAAMLMPVLAAAKKHAQVVKAKNEIAGIVLAINQYDQDNGRFPVIKPEQQFAQTTASGDFTTGLVFPSATLPNPTGYPSLDNNSNVVAILMDLQTYPNGNVTSNNFHVYNPKQVKYLNAKLSGYDPALNDPNPPGGVDNTGVYRDPWGNPYIITMDLSYDDQASDLLYCQQVVSQNGSGSKAGFNGLSNTTDPGGAGNHFLYHGKVMVWSAGPDKKYDANKAATTDVNKDNVLSW
jgi:prepilin-type N-terminal cleavage/methylation domain-containing protein